MNRHTNFNIFNMFERRSLPRAKSEAFSGGKQENINITIVFSHSDVTDLLSANYKWIVRLWT